MAINKCSRKRLILAAGGLAIGLTPLTVFAQSATQVSRVAILCEPEDSTTADELSRFQSRLGSALLKTGRYSLVDRERLDRLIKEQGFSNSAYADPHTAARLGKLAGADHLLNIQLSTTTDADRGTFLTTFECHVSADFTLVNVSTGEIGSEGSADGDAQDKVSAGTGSVSQITVDNLRREAIDSCIDDLVQQLSP